MRAQIMGEHRLVRAIYLLLLFFAGMSTASGATYYVRNGGNDNAEGHTHETAWASIGKVSSRSLRPGDQVLFHEGDSFADAVLVVESSGTSSARIVIGAYYVENGEAKRGLRGEARPVIDGQNERPGSMYESLIRVTGEYVRLENLAIVNSKGRGVVFDGANFGQIVNSRTENMYNSAIRFIKSDDGLAEGNQLLNSGLGWFKDGVQWGAAIAVQHRSARTVIRDNVISKTFGEGINAHHGSTDTLIEGNFIFSARALGIYCDAAPRTTIRRNIILGTTDSSYWRSGTSVGGGIILNNERFHYEGGSALSASEQSSDVQIYGNLVAFTKQGIGFWGQFEQTSFHNILIYNNTLVDNEIQFATRDKPMSGSKFVNNILLSLSSGTKDVDAPAKGLTARNNYFSQGDPGDPFSHSGNIYDGLELSRMSGWRSIDDRHDVSWQDFQPKKASSTIGAGIEADTLPVSIKDQVAADFNSKPYGNPLDIGALRRSELKVPKSPSSLVGRPR